MAQNVDLENWKHAVIRTSNKMFSNTECVFIEYHDCVHLTGFIVLKALQGSCKDILGIDLDQISLLDMPGLLRWYFSREHRNFLIDLWNKDEEIPYKMLDDFLETQFYSEDIYKIPFTSIVPDLIMSTVDIGLVEKIVIYAEEPCEGIKEDVHKLFEDAATVITGDFTEALKNIPVDTTYILSDFEKVPILADTGHLDGAALLLPSNYRYNYLKKDDGGLEPVVNFDYLSKEHKFRLGFLDIGG